MIHLTKGKSVNAPEMTLPIVLQMPTMEIRKLAWLAEMPGGIIYISLLNNFTESCLQLFRLSFKASRKIPCILEC